MKKLLRKIVKKIAGCLKKIVDDELKVIDAFYQQFTIRFLKQNQIEGGVISE